MLGLGIGLSLGARSGGAASVFNPGTLALSGWWKAPYTSSPWVGTASAGASASQDLTEGTNPPTAASGAADFDGTNDQLIAEGTVSDYITASAYSGWAVVNVDAIATDSVSLFDNDALVSDSSSRWFVYLRSSGVVGLHHQQSSTSDRISITAALGTGTRALVQWRYNGTNIEIRVGNGAWQSTAATSLLTDGMAGALNVGRNYNGDRRLNGKVSELATAKVAFTDPQFDNVYSYFLAAYP